MRIGFVNLSMIAFQMLRPYKDSHSEIERLCKALTNLKDKNTLLENSLSAETRIKLDLFSALGEAKRQLEINSSKCPFFNLDQTYIVNREKMLA